MGIADSIVGQFFMYCEIKNMASLLFNEFHAQKVRKLIECDWHVYLIAFIVDFLN